MRHAGLLAALLLTSSFPAGALHSHSNYNACEYTHIEGVVTEFHWMNPHTWIFIEFADESGETVQWSLEGPSPTELIADGWTRDDVEIGDTIKVRCHQLKDRSNGCLLGFLTPEGGVEKEWD